MKFFIFHKRWYFLATKAQFDKSINLFRLVFLTFETDSISFHYYFQHIIYWNKFAMADIFFLSIFVLCSIQKTYLSNSLLKSFNKFYYLLLIKLPQEHIISCLNRNGKSSSNSKNNIIFIIIIIIITISIISTS